MGRTTKNSSVNFLAENVVVVLPGLKIKNVFQSKMPVQTDIKEKYGSRSRSLISMALAFVIHM